MPRIAITGHMNLTTDTIPLIYQEITGKLALYTTNELTGISCLARGADSIFAQAILDLGGKLEVLLPAANYRERKVKPDHAPQFDELTRRATTIRIMPFEEANRAAYEATSEILVSTCDTLYAVWDGHNSTDKGSTGSVVKYARSHGVPVDIIWPPNASRN
ncbi:MAG: hypothetical protein ACRDSH_20715 [Pseudonocardiaceae bacterium]